jgi:glyoxylase-like metal-dependent hydrolase (beta-lactamase superfamily II)/rhodanese-related sulfurtransferase
MDEKSITVDELQQKLTDSESVFILDVRPAEQREEWKIAGSIHLDAYKRLNDGDISVLNEVAIPHDVTVVAVCAAGRTSRIASEALRARGINAYSLEGGMKAWNYAWNMAEVTLPGEVKIIQVRRPAKGVLSYVVGSVKEAVVIDACLDPSVYAGIAAENGWSLKYVLDTHVHADYVSRTRDLAKATEARHLLMGNADVRFQFTGISDGQPINFGNTSLEVIHTPGHTWESTTFRLGDYAIFTCDTLFIDSVGRPDLKAEAIEAIEKAKNLYYSLHTLLNLNDSIVVFPAHTSAAVPFNNNIVGDTLDAVRQKVNVTDLTESQFVEYALSRIPPTPPNYLAIAGLNKVGSYEGHQLADLEAGGNHCAIVKA